VILTADEIRTAVSVFDVVSPQAGISKSLLAPELVLPDKVKAAARATLLPVAEFMYEHVGWKQTFRIGAENFLWVLTDTDQVPFAQFVYLATYPQYAFVLGYDEFRWTTIGSVYGEHYVMERLSDAPFARAFVNLVLPHFRRTRSGVWDFLFPDLGLASLADDPADIPIGRNYQALAQSLKAYKAQDLSTSIISPEIWTSSSQKRALPLANVVQDILRAVYQHGQSLESIHWRTLEELVAELLRSRGLSIYVTPRSSDGGRDVFARGELAGDPQSLRWR
jgi:hypothetical protein